MVWGGTLTVTIRPTPTCTQCSHACDPVCRFAHDQLNEAAERTHMFAVAHRYREPTVEVEMHCSSRDLFAHADEEV